MRFTSTRRTARVVALLAGEPGPAVWLGRFGFVTFTNATRGNYPSPGVRARQKGAKGT